MEGRPSGRILDCRADLGKLSKTIKESRNKVSHLPGTGLLQFPYTQSLARSSLQNAWPQSKYSHGF